jgi:hypothetical protein
MKNGIWAEFFLVSLIGVSISLGLQLEDMEVMKV